VQRFLKLAQTVAMMAGASAAVLFLSGWLSKPHDGIVRHQPHAAEVHQPHEAEVHQPHAAESRKPHEAPSGKAHPVASHPESKKRKNQKPATADVASPSSIPHLAKH